MNCATIFPIVLLRLKKLTIFTVGTILAGLIFCSYGAPVRNHPQTLAQSDGTVVKCFVSGDEFTHWLHDKDNFTIVQNAATGYFVYALLEGGRLVPSDFIVGEAKPTNLGLAKGVRPSPAVMTEKRTNLLMKKAALFTQPAREGLINNIVVFIRFADESPGVFPDSMATYHRMFNAPEADANSVRHYYEEVSYGRLTVVTSFFPVGGDSFKTYQDASPRDYYRKYNIVSNPIGYSSDSAGWARELSLLRNAVNAVVSDIPAGLIIDANNDGRVDNICFIVSGDLEGWGDWVLWPHMSQFPPSATWINGKEVKGYNVQLRDYLFRKESGGVGVLCHEFFHTLGAPDLYHYSGLPPDPVGQWDLMDVSANPPVHMCAYMKYWYGGWIEDIPTISAPGTYTLSPLLSSTGSCYRIPSPYSSSEDFVLEYRTRSGVFESSLPGEGVLVYRINRARVADNSMGPPDQVYIYRPGGTPSTEGILDSAAYSANSGRVSLTDFTTPSGFLGSGVPGGLNLVGVGFLGDSISITLGPRLMPTVSTAECGNVDVGGSSDTVRVTLVNPDQVNLMVTSIVHSNSSYRLIVPSLPINVGPSGSLTLKALLEPEETGYFMDTIEVRGINMENPLSRWLISGQGVVVPPARSNTLYAVTGGQGGGELCVVDPSNGQTRVIGQTGLTDVRGLRVNPKTHQLTAVAYFQGMRVARVNSETAEAYELFSSRDRLDDGFAFRYDATIYSALNDSILGTCVYRIQSTGFERECGWASGWSLKGCAFSPADGFRLWTVVSTKTTNKDSLCTIDLRTCMITRVGPLGVGPIEDIVFDESGKLYGVASTIPNTLVRIDTSTGVATPIGPLGVNSVVGLAAEGILTRISVEASVATPMGFGLSQNYPNPFNSSTRIRYALPLKSSVQLAVYNTLGQLVAILVQGEKEAGNHEVNFDGWGISSGMYFYRLTARNYVQTREFLLLR